MRLLDARRVEQSPEGADGGKVEVEDFVEWGHAVGDLSKLCVNARRRLLE